MLQRRDFILSALGSLGATLVPSTARSRVIRIHPDDTLAEIERRVGGRLGVAVLEVASGRSMAYRADERFAMCSTFKLLLAAQVLARVDRGAEQLDRRVRYSAGDLLEYAPVTREHVGEGAMSIADLCAAAVIYSDNTAANLLLGTVGGPAALTSYVRTLGDDVTRLDRLEPELNSAIPGDVRDTTTPAAMIRTMRKLLLGDALKEASRRWLTSWLIDGKTGAAKLRAGLPTGWRVGDKTGMGANGATNDVAIIWPDEKRTILVAAYLTETAAPQNDRNEALAQVARVVADWSHRT